MSNTNNNFKTQTSNALHNAIMEVGDKDRPPILAPGNYVQWKSRIKRYIDTKPNNELIHYCLQNPPYTFKWAERTIPITEDSSKTAKERPQQAATRNRGKAIVNSPPPTYDQEPEMVAEDDALSKEKEIDKLIGTGYDNQREVNVARARENVGTQVVQQFGIRCYNCKEYRHVARECQKLKRTKDAAYHKENMLLCKQEEDGFQLNVEKADWRDDIDDEPEDQELEAHYLYMAQIQEVTLDVADNSRPIFDAEPLQKVQNNDDNYNVFANDREHPEQPESVNDTYPDEQGDTNITTDSLDMSNNEGKADHDEDEYLARERDLLASLIEKLKCEIDESKDRNKLLESSNKTS
ncbi:integrase, catalytic region, zinc finger, CCHC-type containing protein [Tanacetum coccineum]